MTELKQNFWDTTYTQNISRMIGVCYRYVRNKQVAEDLAHDAFIIAIDKSSDFKGEGHFDAWLRRIAVNEALQYLREQKKKEYHNEWIQYENEMMAANEEVYGMDFTEEELLDAIAQLPEHHKLVFNLYVIDKFSHAEIAQELGISEGTSKSHLARARKKIRTLLLEKEKNRRKIFAFLLPIKLWDIDRTYIKAFRNFEIEPINLPKISAKDSGNFLAPKFNPTSTVTRSFITQGLAFGGIAISLLTVIISSKQEENIEPDKRLAANINTIKSIEATALNSDNKHTFSILKDKNINTTTQLQNIDSASATISDNSIISDENNLNNTDMKTLNTVGAILLAGASMGFDSSKNLTTNLDSRFKLPDVQFQAIQNGMIMQRKEGDGTFNASKIVWSSKNHHVYMKGIGMKAKFEKDKFNATGTVSFLGEVHYLLIDGEEVPLDKDIKLSDGDYSIKALSIQQSIKKYGEKGKNGAVEIAKL